MNQAGVVVHQLALLCWLGLVSAGAYAQTHTFTTGGLTLQLAADGRVSGLLDTVTGTPRITTVPASQQHLCRVTSGGVLHSPTAFSRNGDLLSFTFGTLSSAPVITLRIESLATYLRIRVVGVSDASQIDELRFVNLSNTSGSVNAAILRLLEYVDGATHRYVGLDALDPYTRSEVGAAGAGGYLWASAYGGLASPSPIGLVGRGVALFACNADKASLFAALSPIETDNGIPLGVASRGLPDIDRSAIFWMSLPLSRLNDAVSIAQQAGVGKVIIWAPIWANIRKAYEIAGSWGATPAERLANLRAFAAQNRAAGFKFGAHVYPSILPSDADTYVSAGCDSRLRRERTITLAADLPASGSITMIETTTPPIGWPVQPDCVLPPTTDATTIVIDQEIITYCGIQTDAPPYGFSGPFRRASAQPILGPQSHQAGATIGLMMTIPEQGFFVWDLASGGAARQCSDIAASVNAVGFDFIYNDNLEDAEPPPWYVTSIFPYELYARLSPPPLWMESSSPDGCFSWPLMAVGGQIDYDCTRTFVSEVDRNITWMLNPAFQFDVRQLGWPRPSCDDVNHATPDEFEYLLAKSIAHDAAVVLQLWPQRVDVWPNRDSNLFLMNAYEILRRGHYFPTAVKQAAQAPGVDFMLLSDPSGAYHLERVTHVDLAHNAYQVRGFVSDGLIAGARYVSLWPTALNGTETLYVPGIAAGDIEVRNYGGTIIPVTDLGNGYVSFPVTTRLYIRCNNVLDPGPTFVNAVLTLNNTPCPGDLNLDRLVDERDLGILLGAWMSGPGGDLTGDGMTDPADLGVLLGNWSTACP
ncbi:MAG: hypothetical protein U1D55_14815 [Phycisphaerae bacterium]